jgi:hypothetical protein
MTVSESLYAPNSRQLRLQPGASGTGSGSLDASPHMGLSAFCEAHCSKPCRASTEIAAASGQTAATDRAVE